MFTKDAVKTLHAWGHESLDVLFAHAAKLPPEEFVRTLDGFGQGSVRDQLVHIIFVEEAWVRLLQGIPVQRWTAADESVAAIEEAKQRVFAETLAYLNGLSEAQINTSVPLTPQWSGPPRTPAYIIQHIVTHAFHHKGQVVAMCRLLGHPAPDTDMQRAE